MTFPDKLDKGDTIYIVAPAKAIDLSLVRYAADFFVQAGFQVKTGNYFEGNGTYFSGTIEERLSDFQDALDDEASKAIVCARGGYGCVQLVDRLNWAGFLRKPKHIVGFSDVTVFHQRMARFKISSIHASMPLNFMENSKEALSTLLDALTGKHLEVSASANHFNKEGTCSGVLVGGNLSILYSLLGTDDQINYEGSVLFIEDLAEHFYAIDRMLYAFQKAGILDKINGLIVGGMTDLKDTELPFGVTLENLILNHFLYRNIPICFDFPAGHIKDNRALLLGIPVHLSVGETVKLQFESNRPH